MSKLENKYITEAELLKMIQEEKELVKKEMILREELKYIDKKLAELNEVHTGGAMAPGADGVHAGQQKPVFTKKGTHLIETGEDETDDAPNADAGDMDVDTDTVNVGDNDNDIDDSMGDIDANADAEAGKISKEEVKKAIEALGSQLGIDGIVDFDAAKTDDLDTTAEDEMDVDVETGADDMAVPSDEESGDAPEDNIATSDGETVDECGDDMNEQQPLNENATPTVNTKASQEKNRWNFLINYKKD